MKSKKTISPSNSENSNQKSSSDSAGQQKKFPGYPDYPDSEDIYSHSRKVNDADPDDFTGINNNIEDYGKMNEKDFNEDVTGDDLDVPGADLDDEEEEIGSEDEENDYYSLGGDDHDDLEEDRDN